MTQVELVDRRGHLAQLLVQAAACVIAFVTLSWVPLAVGSAVFAVSAVLWPRGAVVLLVWERLSADRVGRWLDDGRPPRVSTAFAAANLGGAAVLVASGWSPPMLWGALLILAAGLVAEVVVGACVPCEVVVWAARRGWLRWRVPVGETG